jgi:hypothetical protein
MKASKQQKGKTMKTATKTKPKTAVKTVEKTETPVQLISTDDFVEMLMKERGANIISFTHCTTMSKSGKMVKKDRETKTPNPYYGDCFKSQDANGMINFHYDKGVLKRLEKEGKSPEDFKKGESWHEPVIRHDGTLTPFCRSKKDPRKVYLRFMLNQSSNVRYHTANGQTIETENVKPYLAKRSDYANQGLEKPLIFQVWNIDDINKISLNGQKYQIVR